MPLQLMAPPRAGARHSIDLAALIRAEYAEMPGLCLTLAQAARLWNVDRETCQDALDSLTRDGYLYRFRGSYCRRGCSVCG